MSTKRPRPSPPFGGLASFISFLGSIGLAQEGSRRLPFAEPTSNNAIPLAHCLTAFLMSVVVGAQRFAHGEWLRADRVLHALLGLERFPSDDTIRNFFLRFSRAHLEAFWRPLWRWLGRLVQCPAGGFALDLDSTVFCRAGKQEGALKGFNPKRQGRHSHHPLLAVLGVMGREVVVKLSAAWGGPGKHKPWVAATLDWLKCASPKLVPPEDRLAIGGGLI